MTRTITPYQRPGDWDRPDEWDGTPDPAPLEVVIPTAWEPITEEECYLAALLQDRSGLDLAEFAWVDEVAPDGCYRAHPYQWCWWRDRSSRSVDQAGRSVGKSESIMAQALEFPFAFPGQEFVIVAPEGTHADAITDRIEMRLRQSRLLSSMLVHGRSGIKHKPFVATFENGARVYTRLPQRSGVGLKGIHPAVLHVDEAQDVSDKAWKELPEVVRWEIPGAAWKVHGVSKGIQGDAFYRMTQPGSGFTIHKYTGIHKPTWTLKERAQKIKEYGGSVDSPDYKRNVLGEHGAAMNRLFALDRLFACVDTMEASEYNQHEYFMADITADALVARVTEATGVNARIETSSDDMAAMLRTMLDFPAMHKKYEHGVFWVGMDVGVIGDPSEIMVFVEYTPDKAERQRNRRAEIAVPEPGMTRFKLLTRIKLRLLPLPLQAQVVMWVIENYRPRAFALDRTGVGLGLLQELEKLAGGRFVINEAADQNPVTPAAAELAADSLTAIKGYNFSEKIVIRIDEKKADELGLVDLAEILDKAGDRQVVKDRGTDVLREYVDTRRLMLPYDQDVINQLNGQTWAPSQEPIDKYGRRRSSYSIGVFHITDAARMFALARSQEAIESLFAQTREPAAPVIAQFGF